MMQESKENKQEKSCISPLSELYQTYLKVGKDLDDLIFYDQERKISER